MKSDRLLMDYIMVFVKLFNAQIVHLEA